MDLVKDDIVISGIGAHLPKSDNIEEFQQHLFANESLISSRWPDGELGVTNALGTMKRANTFDYIYFRILRQQSVYMDPMHCMALERTFEALIDAGVNPIELKGKRVGCFMGSAIGEEDNLYVEATSGGYGITGHCRAMGPNRISYWLDIHGPSLNYYVNWVSGIEVIRVAYEAIKAGHCESAIVLTTNYAMSAKFNWIYNDMGVLSQDGVVRPFDEDANGYVRSDGIVVFYIQKSSDARRAYATVVKAATCFDGCREGPLIHIDTDNLTSFMEEFYKDCPVKPEQVDFIETYGCGIKDIDKKELEALERVYCKNRKEPLKIGAVKSIAGHSESSASLVSIIKVLIAMENEMIPATINYKKPNPAIAPLRNGSMEVVTKNTPWEGDYAVVNALGMNSYYGHILLKRNPKKKQLVDDDIPRLSVASTRTEEGMQEIIKTIKSKPNIDVEFINLIQEFFSKPTAQHIHRGYVIQGSNEVKEETRVYQGINAPIWFVYSGMGSQWNGMVGDLMKIPIFANAINKCHQVLSEKGVDLINIISSDDPTIFDNILHCFVGIAAIQIALTDVLKALEIVPDGIIGHSVGELGCAYADGCVTAEQMILAAYYRGRASLEATLIKGMMAAVGIGYTKIKDMLPPTIEVACHNGPDSCTISGPTEDMEQFVKKLQNDGIFARLVNVANIAYHSQYIKPAAPILLKYLKKIFPTPVARSSKWISTSNKEENWDTDLAKHSSAEYHTNNLLSSVLFEEGLRHIPKNAVLIEIAPHGLLQAILKRSCKPGCVNVPLTQRKTEKSTEFLLIAIGKLYLAGLTMKISNLYPKIEYPVSRKTPSLATLSHWEDTHLWGSVVDEIRNPPGAVDLQGTLNSTEFRGCLKHQINNNIVVPCSTFLKIIVDITERLKSGRTEYVFENLNFIKPLIISDTDAIPIHAMIQKGSGLFEIVSGSEIFVTGKLTFPNAGEKFMIDPVKIDVDKNSVALSENDIYNEFEHRGYQYSGTYRTLKKIVTDKEGSVGTAEWKNEWMWLLEAVIQQHLLYDGQEAQETLLPKTIVKIVIDLNALPSEQTKPTIQHDYAANVITTDGIALIGFQPKTIEKNLDDFLLDSMEFVPLSNTTTENSQTSIFAALQLVLQNSKNKIIGSVNVTELSSKNSKSTLMTDILSTLKNVSHLKVQTTKVKTVEAITVPSNSPQLVVYNSPLTDELATLLTQSGGYLLVQTSKTILSYPQLVELFQFSHQGQNYSLLRKSNDLEPIFITINENTFSSNDLPNKSLTWVKELDKANAYKDKKMLIVLVANSLPADEVYDFFQNAANMTTLHSISLLFVLNSKLEKNSEILQQIIKRNINVTVLQNNVVGTILPIPAKLKQVSMVQNPVDTKIDIQYVGVNFKNSETDVELAYLDYSGVEDKDFVMGLAHFDELTSKFQTDPILKWKIPFIWSLTNGTTVPSAYANAYYCLMVKGKLKNGNTVFVTSGCTPLGLAVIAIASFHNCKIYTTVTSNTQKTYLEYNFEKLTEKNIFLNEAENIEPLLLEATDGLGVDIVINDQPGSFVESAFRSLAHHGRFVQVDNTSSNDYIGMRMFGNSITFSTVNLQNIYNLPKEVKENLRDLVEAGIHAFTVRPLKCVIHENIDMEKVLSATPPDGIGKSIIKVTPQFPLRKILVTKSLRFVCDKNYSYLVYGGDSNQWCTMVEWLVLRGARKIVVASKAPPKEVYIQRRLAIFQTSYGANISFTPLTAQNRAGASELLSKVNTAGPIDAVFVLPHAENHFSHISEALKTVSPKAVLVNFNGSADGGSSSSSNGFFWFNIRWQNNLSLNEAVACLDQVFKYKIQNGYIRSNIVQSQQSELSILQSLDQILPTFDNVINEFAETPAEPDFVQLLTVGLKEIRELPPIFIIPGLNGQQELLDLSYNLIYPVFKAVLPSKPLPLKELAQSLAKKMLQIFPGKVYNMVSLSWGGALMMEIARILDDQGASLHLFFIDSAPDTLKSAISHLGKTTNEIETNLLTRVFKIDNSNLISSLLDSENWKQRLELVITAYNLKENRSQVEQVLNILKNNVYELKNFQSTEKLVSGLVHLIRSNNCSKYDNCGLTSYCQQVPQITLVEGNHLSIIKNENTIEYINKNHYVI